MTVDSNFEDLFSTEKPARKSTTKKETPKPQPAPEPEPVEEDTIEDTENSEEESFEPATDTKPGRSLFSFGVGAVADQTSPFQTVPLGKHVKRFPIEKLKGVEGVVYRIGLLAHEALVVKFHYEKGIGPFYCFGGKCCAVNGFPMSRYVLPCVKYNTDLQGKPIQPIENFEISFLQLPEDKYTQIAESAEAYDLTQIDFKVTCSDSEYQKINFTNCGEALWRKTINGLNLEKLVITKAQRLIPLIKDVIAQTLTEEEYKERKGDVAPSQGEANISDFGDLLSPRK